MWSLCICVCEAITDFNTIKPVWTPESLIKTRQHEEVIWPCERRGRRAFSAATPQMFPFSLSHWNCLKSTGGDAASTVHHRLQAALSGPGSGFNSHHPDLEFFSVQTKIILKKNSRGIILHFSRDCDQKQSWAGCVLLQGWIFLTLLSQLSFLFVVFLPQGSWSKRLKELG